MRSTKKGDLAISTNAIVILIIAVIMLGLIIGFVNKGFGAVSKKFLQEANKLPDPVAPSASRPITSTENIQAGVGEGFGMKISVYNADPGEKTVEPSIDCGGIVTDVDSNTQKIPGKSVAVFTVIGKVSDQATPGQHLCQATSDLNSAAFDFVLEVS
jgi:hypothetical protein